MSELEAEFNELELNGIEEMEPPKIVKPISRQGRWGEIIEIIIDRVAREIMYLVASLQPLMAELFDLRPWLLV